MKNIKELLQQVVKNSNKGMSSTILALPGTGKTFHLKQVNIQKQFPKDYAVITIYIADLPKKTSIYFYNYLLVELSSLLIEITKDSKEIPTDIMQALQINNEALLISTVKKTIKKILSKKAKLLFIFDDFSNLSNLSPDFFHSLRNIRFVDKLKINFLFLENLNAHATLTKEKLEDLYNYVNESILYLQLPSEENFDKVYNQFTTEYSLKNSTKLKPKIEKLTYGHPALVKYTITSIIKADGKLDTTRLLKSTGIKDFIVRIIDDLPITATNSLFNPKETSEITKILVKLGLLRKDKDGTPKPPGLFTLYKDKIISEKGRRKTGERPMKVSSKITLKDGIVFVEGSPTSEPLSNREYKILKYFDQHKNKVISREQLGKVIWGSKVTEEYSDWAIDQSISRLRKKLGDNAYKPEYLKTIRGRGFILKD